MEESIEADSLIEADLIVFKREKLVKLPEKFNIPPSRIVYVCDTTNDLIAAKRAGIVPIVIP